MYLGPFKIINYEEISYICKFNFNFNFDRYLILIQKTLNIY